jgi:PAS domain S-box-containing protein
VEALGRNVLGNPAVRAIALNVRDVTERVELESQLRTSEERHRLLVQNCSDMIGVIDQDGTCRYASASCERVLGYSPEEFYRKNLFEHVHPEDVEEAWASFSHYLNSPDKTTSGEYRYRHKDGSWRHLETKANNQIANPVLRGIVINTRDITERKRAEKSLEKSEYKYRFLHENLRDASATVNMEGTIVEFNTAFQEMLGYDTEEILRLAYRDITPKKWHAMEEEILWKQLMKRGYSDIYEKEYIRKDGTIVPVELRSHIIRDEDGREIGRWAIVRDISERRRMEAELLRTEKMESLGILSGGIAHDFNNILTAILTNISMARMYGELDEEIEKMLENAEKASLRGKGLTQQLLTFAKGGEPIKKAFSIRALIQNITDFTLSGSNVRCECSIRDGLWHIAADEGQIGQVIQNVVLNAEQAMPGGGLIQVRAENVTIAEQDPLPLEPGNHVKISIIDQGIGIPEEHLKKVFDPFFTTKQKGSGLGLSSSFSIVKRHNGALQVESRLGGGTKIHIYLPALPEAGAKRDATRDASYRGKERVLLIDDDDTLRRSIGQALSRLGYQVECAEDGKEGIRIYEEARASGRPIQVVVMDLTIPGGMGGKEAAREILRIDSDAKLIVSSGYSTDPVMSDFRAHGFRAVISKPYRIEELGKTLRRALTEEQT